MDKVVFDIRNNNIVGYNIEAKPNQFTVYIPSINDALKITVDTVKVNKRNKNGEQLYSAIINGKTKEVTKYSIGNMVSTKLNPIFEENKINKQIKFAGNISAFTLEDILNNKKVQLLNGTNKTNIILNEINLHENVDITYNNHNSDIGFKTIRIPANGNVKLKTLTFDVKTKNIIVNIESDNPIDIQYSTDDINYQSAVNGNIKLSKLTSQIYIKFNNTNDVVTTINSYSILY